MIITSRSGLKYTGFESEKELHQLVWECRVDIPRFTNWKNNDRSKAGLLALGKRPDISVHHLSDLCHQSGD